MQLSAQENQSQIIVQLLSFQSTKMDKSVKLGKQNPSDLEYT